MIIIAQDLTYPKNFYSVHYSIQSKCMETLLRARPCARQYSFLTIWVKGKRKNVHRR